MEITSVISAPSLPEHLEAEQSDSKQPSTLHVIAWIDPDVDRIGVDPRSWYVETFWLAVLGPSAIWLLRRLADRFDEAPEGFELDLDETARSLGLGGSDSRHSPLQRAADRCLRYGMARRIDHQALAVRRRVPPVTRRWAGVYSDVSEKDGPLYWRQEVLPGVEVVTAVGGRGMTCSPAIAEDSLDALVAR